MGVIVGQNIRKNDMRKDGGRWVNTGYPKKFHRKINEEKKTDRAAS